MMTKSSDEPIEWICGLSPDPTRDGKGLGRIFAVAWLRDGGIIDGGVVEPTLTPARIAASYLAATREPKAGKPHVPDSIRVASPVVAAMLRAAVGPGVEVVAAPTPEFDAFLREVDEGERRRVRDDGSGETYFGGDITVTRVSRFFALAAGLYRAAPWEQVPSDDCLVGITCPELGIDGAVVSIMGQVEAEKGFLLFHSHASFLEFLATDYDAPGPAHIPPHLALTYGRGADLAAQRRKEIAAHGFEVADAHAYPTLFVLDDVLPRPPESRDLELAGAVASGLTGLVKHKPDLREAWRGRGTILTLALRTTRGRVEMTISVPHDGAEKLKRGLVKEVRR